MSRALIYAFSRFVQRPTLAMASYQPLLRLIFEGQASLSYRRAKGVGVARVKQGGISGLQFRPEGIEGAASVLYLHGGGFTIGSARTHKWMIARLAKAAGRVIFAPDYRLAPEHPFPAALEDCERVFDALCARGPVAVAGDSAGGCLALALCASRAPERALLFSPLTDLADRGGDFSQEILLPKAWVRRALKAYLRDHDPADPRVSPLHADLRAAPPMWIEVAKNEVLERQSRRLLDVVAHAHLEVTPGVPHVWQLWAGWLHEADASLARAGQFLKPGIHLPQ